MSNGDERSTIPIPEATTGDYHHRCSRCLLPETYPDIHFNEDGICNFCIEYEQKNTVADSSKRKKRKEWMEKFILDAKRRNKSKYDILVSYSGGKDSTYLLYLLKEQFGLRVLAYSCDTGFMSEEAHRNVNRTIAKLGVDHVWRRPGEDFYRKLYSYLLTHPGKDGCVATVCPQCFQATSIQATKTAMEHKIPLVAYGFSPAQIGGTRYRIFQSEHMLMLLSSRLLRRSPFQISLSEEERKLFHIRTRDFWRVPHILYPFNALDYDIEQVKKTVIGQGLIAAGDEHPLRSNCHVNLLMIELDWRRSRYHPYAKEFSQLVREGQLSRQEWIEQEDERIKTIEQGAFERDKIDSVLERLGLKDYYQACVEKWR